MMTNDEKELINKYINDIKTIEELYTNECKKNNDLLHTIKDLNKEMYAKNRRIYNLESALRSLLSED